MEFSGRARGHPAGEEIVIIQEKERRTGAWGCRGKFGTEEEQDGVR